MKAETNPQASLSQLRANRDSMKAHIAGLLADGMPAEDLLSLQTKLRARERNLRDAETLEASSAIRETVQRMALDYDRAVFRYKNLILTDDGSGVMADWRKKNGAGDDEAIDLGIPEAPKESKNAACDLATVSADALMAELERRETEATEGNKANDDQS